MIDVCPSMYSPDAWPSGRRAAPAKKRRLSHMNGISSSRKASRGLPASAASRSDSSSACSSIRSASLSSAVARSPGGVTDHSAKARFAAATARFTSSSVESGISAITSPLAGFVTSSVPPSAASTNSPSMKFCSLVLVIVAMRGVSFCLPQALGSADARGLCLYAVTLSTSSTGVYSMPVPSATAGWVTLPWATFTPGPVRASSRSLPRARGPRGRARREGSRSSARTST